MTRFGGSTQNLGDEVGPAFEVQFFGHNAQGAVGRDEIYRLNALVAIDGEQKVAKKDCSTCAGSRNSQVLRRELGKSASNSGA